MQLLRSLGWCCGLLLSATAMAQAPQQSIFDYLAGSGRGNVTIHQPEYIRSLIGRRSLGGMALTENATKARGFRIQVYSGNKPNSKDVATQREALVKSLHPDIPTYVNYNAPFWKLRIGNFASREEAEGMLNELKLAFPQYGREMYVVRDVILIPF